MKDHQEPRLEFRPKLDKIVELLLYLAHKKPNSDQYQAVKFFYLADRAHLNRYGRPITFDAYYALQYGPVASRTFDLLKGDEELLAEAGCKHGLPIEMRKLAKILYLSTPKRAVDYDLFSKSDLIVFDEVLEHYGDKSFNDLFEITHDHFAYQNAWRTRGTKKSAPMNYADMLEDSARKASLLDDVAPVAAHMK